MAGVITPRRIASNGRAFGASIFLIIAVGLAIGK